MAEPTMRCLYCGGPQSAEQPACPTCGAVARFVTCTSCKSKVPAGDEKCKCGATIDPGAKTTMSPPCPRCPGHALVLRRMADGATALQCEHCNGCFVRVRDWSLIVDDSASGHPVDTTAFAVSGGAKLAADALAETARCPACGRDMDRFHFGVNTPAVVDVCETHGMWLDAGELAIVLAAATAVAKSGHLPAESAADRAADAALHDRLGAEEVEVDRNAEIARANFRTDPAYRLTEDWDAALSKFADLLSPRAKRP